MEECSECSFVLLPGERTCPECGFGSEDWVPDDDRGLGEVFSGP